MCANIPQRTSVENMVTVHSITRIEIMQFSIDIAVNARVEMQFNHALATNHKAMLAWLSILFVDFDFHSIHSIAPFVIIV